ncbi:MAG: flagellar hook-basal body complex protein FliE [Lachnospiraceae bacterium]
MNVTDISNFNMQPLSSLTETKSLYGTNSLLSSTDGTNTEDMFSSIFEAAVNNINTTNKYLSEAENEEIKLALGQSDNAHDLAIALQKASTTLQYTVAIRDKFLEAYKEIMNMQF